MTDQTEEQERDVGADYRTVKNYIGTRLGSEQRAAHDALDRLLDRLRELREERDTLREALGADSVDGDGLIAALDWALDIMGRHEAHLIDHGDAPEKVRSPTHMKGKHKARAALRYARSALDESEGRGGGEPARLHFWYCSDCRAMMPLEWSTCGRCGSARPTDDCNECGHPLDSHGYSGCRFCECDHDAFTDLPSPDLQPSDSLETDSNTYVCPKCGSAVPNHACDETAAHTPAPSDADHGIDSEELTPDERRAFGKMLRDRAEDAEDDGRGEWRSEATDVLETLDQMRQRVLRRGKQTLRNARHVQNLANLLGRAQKLIEEQRSRLTEAPTHSDADPSGEVAEILRKMRKPVNVGKPMSKNRGGGRAGHIYVRRDPQERLGEDTWAVVMQGDGEGPYSDTTQLGLFWRKPLAEAFARRLRRTEDAGEGVEG